GGDGVSAGYLNNPELTAEKFIENPYGDGRVYRSGDVGRYLPDGTIEYLGRMDEQVKIRGYRIELGEIEQALLQLEGIKQAAVIEHKTEQDHSLYAYLVGEGELAVSTIRQELLTHLPEYMIPRKMMQLNRLPMTHNGKLDKKALPEIQTTITNYESPETETEYCLQELFETILELDSVSVTESFFLLGGDSIKAMRIVSRAREAGYDLKVQTILEKRTIRNIAQQMQKTTDKEKWEQGEIVGKVTDTPILRMFKQWALPEPTHFNQSVIISTALPNQESLQLVLDKIIAHHDSLRARYVEGQLTVYSMAESEFYRLSERTFDSGSSTFERDWAEEMK
ncbi:phosphopantetheine-binding protein, partial [Listeria innocua]|uniref:phosphopantetheine-binding protein n=1 Tax=Listeria innocua TaxID=1642 RepID=UPI001629FB86